MLHFILVFKFQLLFLTLHAYQIKDFQNETSQNTSFSTNIAEIHNATNNNLTEHDKLRNDNVEVIAEGGKVTVSQISSNPGYGLTSQLHYGREHEYVNPLETNTVPSRINVKKSETSVKGEHLNFNSIPSEIIHKQIVGRKGVQFNQTIPEFPVNINVTGINTTTSILTNVSVEVTTMITVLNPKKPTVTVGADESYKSLYLEASKSKSNITNSQLSEVPKNMNSNTDREKFVVPIVLVILSVPFVAIILSVIYKRGSDWWKYRHYRRMDFLINGMYDA